MDEKWIPQNNLEELSREFVRLTNGSVIDHSEGFTTTLAPGFFYNRNYIKELTVPVADVVNSILEKGKDGMPTLTSFTEDLVPAETKAFFLEKGFVELFVQHGMVCHFDDNSDTLFSHKSHSVLQEPDSNIDLLASDEWSQWTSAMIKGFAEENKQREDVVFENMIKSPDICFLGYRHNGKIIGTAMLHYTSGLAGLHEVAVPREYRRQGVASKLVARALQIARDHGAQGMTLQASPKGRLVYQSFGFYDTGLIHSMYHPDIPFTAD